MVYALRQYCLRLDDIGGRNYPTEDQSQGASEREAAYLQCADDIRAMIAAELSGSDQFRFIQMPIRLRDDDD